MDRSLDRSWLAPRVLSTVMYYFGVGPCLRASQTQAVSCYRHRLLSQGKPRSAEEAAGENHGMISPRRNIQTPDIRRPVTITPQQYDETGRPVEKGPMRGLLLVACVKACNAYPGIAYSQSSQRVMTPDPPVGFGWFFKTRRVGSAWAGSGQVRSGVF